MKKLFYTLCLATLAACGSGSDKPTIEAKWKLENVSGENLTESEKKSTIEFMADGNFVMRKDEGHEGTKGTWKLSEDGKNLLLTRKNGDTKECTNVEVTEETLSFTEGDEKITFKKVE